MVEPTPFSLSSASEGHTNWQAIDDVFALLIRRSRAARSPAVTAADHVLTPKDMEKARRAFEVVREEFDTTLGWTATMMRWITAGIALAVGLAVVGGALVQLSPWASLISVGSIASLFALIPKAQGLVRDQAMLQLIPARYSLALELCRSQDELQTLMVRFLDETSSGRLRKPVANSRPRRTGFRTPKL